LDFETRSRCDLPQRGAYNYAMDLSTDVLCMSYAFDDDDVRTWLPGEPFPEAVRNHTGQIRAHNAAFERLIFWYVCQIPFKLEQFYCTAAQARANCAPGKLEDVGRFAGASMRKDHRGAQLIRLLSIPQADGTFRDDEDLMAEMIQYCEQDVRAMREISKAQRELSADELRDYHVNERINDRGVLLDKRLALAAVRYAEAEAVEIQDIVREVTGGEITSVRSPKMRAWVLDRVGPEAKRLATVYKDGVPKLSIDKNVRANLLAFAEENPDEVPADVAEVIQCADDLWASSVAKFARAAHLADEEDHRVRGAFVFAGGSATGRASSFGLQVHNFPRRCADNPSLVREAMVRGHQIVPQHGKRVTDVLKGMLRPSLMASPGKHLVVADWAAIEARVTPWASNTNSGAAKLDIFAKGEDVYKHNAAATFRVPYDQVDKDQRQIGKVQELACLAEDTLVFTDNGLKAIVDVQLGDLLWDGHQWVNHRGVVSRGVKPVVNVFGVLATEDHLFLAKHEWVDAKTVLSSKKYQTQIRATGMASLPYSGLSLSRLARQKLEWLGCSVHAVLNRMKFSFITCLKAHPNDATLAPKNNRGFGEKTISNTPTLALMTPTDAACSIVYRHAKTDATIQTTVPMLTMAGAGSRCTNLGAQINPRFCVTSSPLMDGTSRDWSWTASTLTKDTNPVTFGLSPARKTSIIGEAYLIFRNASLNLKPVYDIAHAGPRNRFMIFSDQGPLIVHNCGFAGGVGAFAAMGRIYNVVLTESESRKMVDAWRRANSWSVPYWSKLEQCYTAAMRNPGQEFTAGRVTYLFDKQHLWYALPSGRVLCYPFARFDEEGNITYAKASWKPAADAKEWPRARLWRGLACENITQAVANDLLRHTLRKVEEEGLDCVLHVHDEVVLETADPDTAADTLLRIMTTAPAWAQGLPLNAEVAVMTQYGK
jgi:hypothetical protein